MQRIGYVLTCMLCIACLRVVAEETWKGAALSSKLQAETLPAPFEQLKRLHTPLHAPGESDWLALHRETGQTFAAFKNEQTNRGRDKLTTIYILPMGDFTEEQLAIVQLTAQFMELYFALPVRMQPPQSLAAIPADARRQAPNGTQEQLLTRYILQNVLKPSRPADALAYLALTASDLWPGEGWNFVYGQASLRDRVGVWSLARNGDPHASAEAYALYLRRALQTATHETGHLLGIHHCLAYECNMNGANNRAEADRRPLALCPCCLAKLSWRVTIAPKTRFQKLILFCNKHGLETDCTLFAKEMVALP